MLYELTLTIRPQWYKKTPREQYDMCKTRLYEIFRLSSFKQGYKVSLVAELTEEHNVHVHGIIDLAEGQKDQVLNRFREYNTFFGKKTITQLCYYETWVCYINKDKISTQKVLGCSPVIVDVLGVLGAVLMQNKQEARLRVVECLKQLESRRVRAKEKKQTLKSYISRLDDITGEF